LHTFGKALAGALLAGEWARLYLRLAMRTLTTGTGAGSFAASSRWAFAMALRFKT
jgi:hypothetical protein